MKIRYLKLLNFRNYSSLETSFSDKLNLIYGKNGMGKTNLVEAIYVLALTKSFRTTNDQLLILKDKDILKIEGNIEDKVEHNFKIILNSEGKKVKINNNKIPKLSDYISKFNVIFFGPDDLRIIKDAPSIRRKKLNMELSQLNNQYLKYLNKYNKILKQRNAYLRAVYINGNSSKDYLNILTNELIDTGEKIYLERKKFFENINKYIDDLYFKITKEKGLKVEYISSFNNYDKEKLLQEYKKMEKKDITLGKTHLGVHHDEYMFKVLDNLKDYGSEGQQKNAIIAYKMAEMEIFFKEKKAYPVFILDDLFSELDEEKIKNILTMLDENVQTFITTTDLNYVDKSIKDKSKCFYIDEGILKEEN